MIGRDHKLHITHQARLLDISRGTVYYLPQPVSPAGVALMRKIDELHLEADPVARTPRTGKSVVRGRPVRSLATNRKPAVGGQRGGVHCNGASVRFLPSARQRRSNCAGGTFPNDECVRSVL